MVQLHGDLPAYEIARLRAMAPDLAICKSLVVRPEDHDLLDGDVSAFSPWVDAFLTDTFDPATGASGATGRTHDWAISRRLAARSSRPLILAGGLTAANVAAAVARVRPAGVDVHTGIEGPDGRKDATLAREFVRHATAAELPSERGCGRIL
jgi:phosphoribosylanthranilate isomerase